MRKTLKCPQPGQLEKFATGDVPMADMEAFVQHLQSCSDCLAKVQTLSKSDTLTETIRRAGRISFDPDDEIVSRMVERLKKLRHAGTGGKEHISFVCSACGKKLRTKAEFAGKKAKCPGCGIAVVVRANGTDTLAQSNAQQPTPSPEAPAVDAKNLSTIAYRPAEPGARSLNPGQPSMSDPEVTVDPISVSPENRWDFLAPPEQPDEIGRLGPYRVLSVLGRGGMGVVFRAEDPNLERLVALKAMLPTIAAGESAKTRFLREARTAASIKHDNIVTIFKVGEDGGAPYLAMEFLEGEPLDVRLKREPILPLPEILHISREIAEGLAAAHDKGLIHRDIKPGNVWLEERDEGQTRDAGRGARGERTESSSLAPRPASLAPRVKILDFGLARSTSENVQITQSGAIIGTPAYMAPEQAMGLDVDHRVDLFSLGCVLYRLCTGEMPFKGKNAMAILASIAIDIPTPPNELNPSLPKELTDLIERLLAKDADARPASAREVAEALHHIEEQIAKSPTIKLPAIERPTGPEEKMAKPAPKTEIPRQQRRKLIWAAAGFVLIAVLLSGIVLFVQTLNGVIRVEVNDPKIQVQLGKGELKLSGVGSKEITIQPGENWLHIERDGFKFDTKQFVLRKGEKVTLSVDWLADGKVQVKKNSRTWETQSSQKKMPTQPAASKDRKDNYALYFNGIDSFVHLPSFKLSNEPVTAEAWIRSEGGDLQIVLFAAGPEQMMAMYVHGYGCGFTFGTHTKRRLASRAFAGELRNRWVHLAGSWDGQACTVFVNGQPQRRAEIRSPVIDKFIVSMIGADRDTKTLSQIVARRYYRGAIDQARISRGVRYKNAFKPSRRLIADKDTVALYYFDEGQGDKLLDSSGNGHHGKIVGAKWVKVGDTDVRPPTKLTANDPERRAAEWVLSVGGKVYFREGTRDRLARSASELPTTDLRMSRIDLNYNKKITDEQLVNLNKLQFLKRLDLANTRVTGNGLKYISDLQTLETLDIGGTAVDNAGLVSLKNLRNLKSLSLMKTRITDEGLVHLGELPLLTSVLLNSCRIQGHGLAHLRHLKSLHLDGDLSLTDAGMAHFKHLTDLESLVIQHTRISDVGVGHLAPLKKLRKLDLNGVRFTDAGLKTLRGLSKLETLLIAHARITDDGLPLLQGLPVLSNLNLADTLITDKGLPKLAKIRTLRVLNVYFTKVTLSGLKKFKAALPKCQIHSKFKELRSSAWPPPIPILDRNRGEPPAIAGGETAVRSTNRGEPPALAGGDRAVRSNYRGEPPALAGGETAVRSTG